MHELTLATVGRVREKCAKRMEEQATSVTYILAPRHGDIICFVSSVRARGGSRSPGEGDDRRGFVHLFGPEKTTTVIIQQLTIACSLHASLTMTKFLPQKN